MRAAERRESRQAALVDAAFRVFMEKGVAASSVDDIVEAAGVAKGTFYLYFRTKDDAINAVAERIVDGVGGAVEAAATTPGLSSVDRLLSLGRSSARSAVSRTSASSSTSSTGPRTGPSTTGSRSGSSPASSPRSSRSSPTASPKGSSHDQDPHLAAGFVLATFTSLHDLVGDEADVEQVASELNAFILRGLGYRGDEAR